MEVIAYLEGQLEILEDELKTFEVPIQNIDVNNIRQIEEVVLKRQIWQLKALIKGSKAIASK